MEGESTFMVFLGSGVFGSGINCCFGGVIGLNQSAYSRSKIVEGGVGEAVRDRLFLRNFLGLEKGV